jgi:exopolysaccharide production protein ExoZ
MQQLKSIHYLRAVAAIMVVIFHIFNNVTFMRAYAGSVYWLQGGVEIFFVISGYVMVKSTENGSVSPKQFITQRAKRIIPMYWIATVATMMQIDGRWDFKIKSFLFIPAQHPENKMMQPVLEPGWTLNYEMFFYVIFALSLFLNRKHQVPFVATFIVTMVFLGLSVDGNKVYEFYGRPIILEFLMGMMIAKMPIRWPIAFLPAGFLLMYFLQPYSVDRVFKLGLPAMMIVAGAISAEIYIRHSKILNLLGSASFSIYLFHLITIGIILHLYSAIGLNHFTFLIISLIASLICGCAFYWTLERPIIAYFNKQKIKEQPLMRT